MKVVKAIAKVLTLILFVPMVASAQPVKGSHLKVFIPSLPYIYISHSINAALLKPANNERGWEYDMAVAHRLCCLIRLEDMAA
ncbi:hypothetical protein [Enterovibrio nigricans]|uniref:Uncharacterized protein n=1 Tax=Enterovibrio nigricans DSM 22720 TaxID=1121868 RepID=A0A1T4VU51_9GAMM|nr:hypothetical protein [Enterovibrio nigricans]SKA68512.1 hypothetical protein SAMN02745132_04298 [Enterovibrio nigricans DSM 22720]